VKGGGGGGGGGGRGSGGASEAGGAAVSVARVRAAEEAAGTGAAASLGRILFVGNDWPCAPLALRLAHCVRGGGGDRGGGSDDSGDGGGARPPLDAAHFQDTLAAALADARSAFCIHNLAYQGGLPAAAFERLCLPARARAALAWPQPDEGPARYPGPHPDAAPSASRTAPARDAGGPAADRAAAGAADRGAAAKRAPAAAGASAAPPSSADQPAASPPAPEPAGLAAREQGAPPGAAAGSEGNLELGTRGGGAAAGGQGAPRADANGGARGAGGAAAGGARGGAAVSLNWMHVRPPAPPPPLPRCWPGGPARSAPRVGTTLALDARCGTAFRGFRHTGTCLSRAMGPSARPAWAGLQARAWPWRGRQQAPRGLSGGRPRAGGADRKRRAADGEPDICARDLRGPGNGVRDAARPARARRAVRGPGRPAVSCPTASAICRPAASPACSHTRALRARGRTLASAARRQRCSSAGPQPLSCSSQGRALRGWLRPVVASAGDQPL